MAYEPNEFGYKDGLPSGDPDKVIKGSDFDVEFNAIKEALDSVDVEVNVDDINGLKPLLDDKADKSDLEQEIQERKDGDAVLQGQIDNFENYDDLEIRADLAQETNDRIEGDQVLQGNIDGVSANLSQEIRDRQNADIALGDRIDNLVTDDLADVNSENAKVDQFLIHNGSQWVAEDFHIDTELTYQGGISVVNDPAPSASNGDLYINSEAGTVGASWTGIAGKTVTPAVAVGWSTKNARWYMLGDIASAAVMRVEAGLGIDVDDTKPAEPVVSIDRTETDKWYAPLWEQSGDNIYYDKGNVGIGGIPGSTISGGTAKLQVAGDGYFSGRIKSGDAVDTIVLNAWSSSGYIQFQGANVIEWRSNLFFPSTTNAVDLGTSSKKFKDGHFSGTIYGTVDDVPSHVKSITPTQIANWDAGTGGGGGGATTDGRISDTQITHWDQAYGWGNHATAGYQPAGNYASANHDHSGVYQPVGNYADANHNHSGVYQPVGNYLTPSSLNGYATESWVSTNYQPKGNYALVGASYTKAESDAKYELKGQGGGGDYVPLNGNSTVTGTITATDFIATSDERKKTDISQMPLGLIDAIKPVTFKWKDSGESSGGVIAQQLKECGLDDWVRESPDSTLGVDYTALIGVLLSEVQDLKLRVKELEGWQ